MPAKKTPAELQRVGRGNGRDSGGRVIGAERGSAVCPHAARKLVRAKRIISDETFALFLEGIERIEAQTPHFDGGYHGIPDDDALDDIAIVERALNTILPPELELRSAHFYNLISRSSYLCED